MEARRLAKKAAAAPRANEIASPSMWRLSEIRAKLLNRKPATASKAIKAKTKIKATMRRLPDAWPW